MYLLFLNRRYNNLIASGILQLNLSCEPYIHQNNSMFLIFSNERAHLIVWKIWESETNRLNLVIGQLRSNFLVCFSMGLNEDANVKIFGFIPCFLDRDCLSFAWESKTTSRKLCNRVTKKLRITSGFREVFAQQKFGWKKLQVSGISKSLLVASARPRDSATIFTK